MSYYQYQVNCPSAPFENTMFRTLDECWTLCLDLSEEYGFAEVLFCALNGNKVTKKVVNVSPKRSILELNAFELLLLPILYLEEFTKQLLSDTF